MDSPFAIQVENVSKAYRIWTNPSARLTSGLWLAAARPFPPTSSLGARLRKRADRYCRNFYALRDVSFAVGRGQGVGIIGRNGAGKSTLLQLIAGTLQPTSGSVRVRGRVAALLELGSGFNPDFTGRENVYLNATVLGLSRDQIDARFQAIADFAEIGEFIEHPVHTYSSGMIMRLAFAVAAHVDPDILIIDEALGVGDARFQLKCSRAIDRFIEQGVTLLFVSHDTSSVKRLCQSAVLLEGGQMAYAGAPNDVTNLYSKLIADGGSLDSIAPDIEALQDSRTSSPTTSEREEPLGLETLETALRPHAEEAALAAHTEKLLTGERSKVQVTGQEFAYGGKHGRILDLSVTDSHGLSRPWFGSGERIEVRMAVESDEDFADPIFALTIKNTAGMEIYGTNTLFSNQPAPAIRAGKKRLVTFRFDANLMRGFYFLSFGFTHFMGGELLVVHRRYDALKIEIHPLDRSFGIANLKAEITSRDLP